MDESEIEKILLEHNEIDEILRDDPPWKFPTLDYGGFNEEIRTDIEKNVEEIKGYLSLPYIIDKFGNDHSKRRSFTGDLTREKMELGEYYKIKNSLSWNNTGAACSSILNLPIYYSKYYHGKAKITDIYNQIKIIENLIDGLGEGYHQGILTTDEKVKKIKQIKENFFSLLQLMSENSSN